MKLPSAIDFPFNFPIFSTSGTGFTPGNNTKKIGVTQFISSQQATMSNGYYSVYSNPMLIDTNSFNAYVSLSGLMALNNRVLWKREIFATLFGRSTISGFSSEYHFLQSIASLSIYQIKCSNIFIFSSPLTAAQTVSGKNFNDSIQFGGSKAISFLIRASYSLYGMSPFLIIILKHNIVEIISL